jgi:hypothetical protein
MFFVRPKKKVVGASQHMLLNPFGHIISQLSSLPKDENHPHTHAFGFCNLT